MPARLSFPTSPSLAAGYLRALLDRRPRRLPPGQSGSPIEAEVGAVQAEPSRLAAYREVCGIPDDEQLPLTYPHVLAGGTHLAMLLHPDFPVKVFGLVHLSNEIELVSALPAHAPLALDCRLQGARRTPRGDEFRLTTEALVGGELAWREAMVFLVPAHTAGPRPAQDRPELPPPLCEFPVPADTGRRYARVSGDWNPIHLAAILARPFGFGGAIAHGMWTLARCLGWLAQRPVAPGARLVVRFMRPLLLPGKVRLHVGGVLDDAEREFWLVAADDGRPHLRGSWRNGG